jgi:hypothetical protein
MRAQEHNPAKHMLVASCWNFSFFPSSSHTTRGRKDHLAADEREADGDKGEATTTKCWEGACRGCPSSPVPLVITLQAQNASGIFCLCRLFPVLTEGTVSCRTKPLATFLVF